tara:strand:+ start:627 stop:1937 length:1311 start_codon:yes stop_codon:yes gene_type:complete
MNSFKIHGGTSLSGTITPQGAKNEALQIICAVLLTDEKITIKNIPDIRDIRVLIDLIKKFGVEVNQLTRNDFEFKSEKVNLNFMQSDDFYALSTRIRGSIMIMGPLLARFQKAFIPRPGGDKIGRRRLDTHFIGFEKLGAKFLYDDDKKFYSVNASKIKGNEILLDEASVTGTANILMASVFCEGTTKIYNAACEPYLQQLCKMLNNMGANITGIGSNLLTVIGVKKLNGCTHKVLPDMIEIGSFIGLAAITKSQLRIKDVSLKNLGIIPSVFKKLGINLEINGDDIIVNKQNSYEVENFIDGSILTISDAPWPGFTPDLISIILVVATQAKGSVLIHQKMFESRLFFVDKLIEMGAKIILCDPHRATVIGLEQKSKLKGTVMTSPDIRAGVALLIAALSAKGTSIIHNVEQIDRGYEDIDIRLNQLGAKISRIDS